MTTALRAARRRRGWTRATLASAAAWSFNPNAQPFCLGLHTTDGEPQPGVLARWAANAPLAMVDQYVRNLRRYTAIALDCGAQDGLRRDTEELHRILDRYGIANTFVICPGDHVNAVADRMQNHVLPFFGRNLVLEGDRFERSSDRAGPTPSPVAPIRASRTSAAVRGPRSSAPVLARGASRSP